MTVDPCPPAGLPPLNLKQARVVVLLRDDADLRDAFNGALVEMVRLTRLLDEHEADDEKLLELAFEMWGSVWSGVHSVAGENRWQEQLRVPLLDPEED